MQQPDSVDTKTVPRRIGYCHSAIADSELLVRQVAPPKMSYSLPLST